MKISRKLLIVLSAAALIFFAIFFIACRHIDGYSQKEAALMAQVVRGMDSNQVIAILGPPDSRYSSSSDSTYLFEYFTNNKAWSTLPFVEFDSTGKVTWVCYHMKFQ